MPHWIGNDSLELGTDAAAQSIQVELILDKLLADFAEEVVVFKPAEPLHPAHIDVLAEL